MAFRSAEMFNVICFFCSNLNCSDCIDEQTSNYSVDRSLFAFLLPPTEATATAAETGPGLSYLHICIIKIHLWKYRRIWSVTLSTHYNILWQKDSWQPHLRTLSQHLSLLPWKHQHLFSRHGNKTDSTPSLEAVCAYNSRCVDLYGSIILLLSNAVIIRTFDRPNPSEFSDALTQNNTVHFIMVK